MRAHFVVGFGSWQTAEHGTDFAAKLNTILYIFAHKIQRYIFGPNRENNTY